MSETNQDPITKLGESGFACPACGVQAGEEGELLHFGIAAASESETRTRVRTEGFEITVDEPVEDGGTGMGPNPVEYLFAALAGCLNNVAYVVAEEKGIEFDELSFDIEGQLNPAKFEGEETDVRPGYQSVDITMWTDANVDDQTLEEWGRETEERCAVTDNVKNQTPISMTTKAP